jgi:hypothetical protein
MNMTSNQLTLVHQITGNSTSRSMDYFNIGASLDLIEHNWNHAQLFYTSTLRNTTSDGKRMNYTHINLLYITRFQTSTALHYRFLNSVNLLRDQSDDSFDLGRIGISLYNQSMLLTMEK